MPAPVCIRTRALSGICNANVDTLRMCVASGPTSVEFVSAQRAPERSNARGSFMGSFLQMESQTTMDCQCGLSCPLWAGKKPRYTQTTPPFSDATIELSSRAARHLAELGM